MLLPVGRKLFRGGACRSGKAFYTTSMSVAKMYGRPLCEYVVSKKPLNLFVITHDSLKRVFKYLSNNTRLLLSFVFGTGLKRTDQKITLKKLFGSRFSSPLSGKKTPGQRLSVSEIDTVTLEAFAREYLHKNGYDGVYMPPKISKFHKGLFHSEVYISKYGLVNQTRVLSSASPTTEACSPFRKEKCGRSSTSYRISPSMSELFIKYTKGTRGLLRPYPSKFVMYLSGGMAVKLYLGARGIKTAKTSDFDFKFAVPRALKTQAQIDELSKLMRMIMFRHVSGFVRYLNRNGIQATMEFKEVQGVPLDKPGGTDRRKKVYRVFNYTIVTPGNKRYELIDTSLVLVPGVSRDDVSLRWSRKLGFPIQKLTRLWKDTLYVLAGSFVYDTIKLRNPIDGAKKEKGLKNSIRAGHLSYLIARKKKTARLVNVSRRLIQNVIRRNKASGTRHAQQVLRALVH